MVIDYYDTSALLAKPELIKSNYDNYISHFVIKELEDIKQSSNKSEDIKASFKNGIWNLEIPKKEEKKLPEKKYIQIDE